MIKIGDSVVFCDSIKQEHNAVVTNVFGEVRKGNQYVDGELKEITFYPCVNLVYVSSDESKQDNYGRQLERVTSIVHISVNSAGAFCYKFVGE